VNKITDLQPGADGYLRLCGESVELLELSLTFAGVDAVLKEYLASRGIDAVEAGFCEWESQGKGAKISIGWEWMRLGVDQTLRVVPGSILSNLMLTTQSGNELGAGPTSELLELWLASFLWRETVARFLGRLERRLGS
jgi:hypothetical protein